MPVVATNPTNFPRRINMYVPAMQYASDVNMYSNTRTSFGAPSAPVTNNLLNLQSNATNGTVFDLTATASAQTIFEPFGRSIQIVASAAATNGIIIRGADYLGQPLAETVLLAGTVAVESKRMFKYVDSIQVQTGTAATTFNAGWGGFLGLPYKAIRIAYEIANGATVATLGTFIAPALADPANNPPTGDTRGAYKPTTVLNGANIISIVADYVNDINSNNNGGLHGIRTFFG